MRPRMSATPAALTPWRFTFLAWGPHAPVDPEWPYDDDIFEAHLDDDALRRLWALHGEAVLAEAARRGIARPLWVEQELGVSR